MSYNYKKVRTTDEGCFVDPYGSLQIVFGNSKFITGIIADGHFIEFNVSKHRHYKKNGRHV